MHGIVSTKNPPCLKDVVLGLRGWMMAREAEVLKFRQGDMNLRRPSGALGKRKPPGFVTLLGLDGDMTQVDYRSSRPDYAAAGIEAL